MRFELDRLSAFLGPTGQRLVLPALLLELSKLAARKSEGGGQSSQRSKGRVDRLSGCDLEVAIRLVFQARCWNWQNSQGCCKFVGIPRVPSIWKV